MKLFIHGYPRQTVSNGVMESHGQPRKAPPGVVKQQLQRTPAENFSSRKQGRWHLKMDSQGGKERVNIAVLHQPVSKSFVSLSLSLSHTDRISDFSRSNKKRYIFSSRKCHVSSSLSWYDIQHREGWDWTRLFAFHLFCFVLFYGISTSSVI